jgi:hypothetical protein
MANKPFLNVITTSCQSKDVEEFNKWYNEVHVPMLLKSGKLKGVARYKSLDDSNDPRFIAMYRFDSDKDFASFEKSPEAAAASEERKERWGNKIELISRVQYELIKEW